MSAKRLIKMTRQSKACSKYCRKRHAAAARMHFCAFARYACEAFLLLFLFFTLPHVVYGITNTPNEESYTSTPQPLLHSRKQPIESHGVPNFLSNRTVIVELFEWKFVDVAAECTNFLGPKGFAGVQLSPVTEHLLSEVQTQSWLARYQPISLKFATRSGSIEDFLAMSRACNAAGVRVYVDVVLNHMAGDTTKSVDSLLVGTAGSVANVSALDYNAVPFDASDFHRPCLLKNYMDAFEVRNCQLNGQPDLEHSKEKVQLLIVEFLNLLIRMGVAGFRIDAAKYMWPDDLKAIYGAVFDLNSDDFDFEKNSRPLFYQEVVDLGMDAVSKTEYSRNGIVTEYLYAAELSTIFSGKVPLSSLINWGPAMGFLPHQDALVFVDTHESQHGYLERELGKNELLSYKQQRHFVMATAFMLAHPYGRLKRILSSYHFAASDKQRGPPTVATVEDNGEETVSILSPEFDISTEQCKPGWVCEHRWPAIVNMLALVNALSAAEDGVTNFQTYGPNHIAFCRGQKAFIAINNDAILDYATTVYTCLEPGIYCDVISGGRKADGSDCHGKRIVVKENGIMDLILPAMMTIQNNPIDIDNDNNAVEVEEEVEVDVDVDGQRVDTETDAEADDDGDGNGDVEWEGLAVDIDYGVIAIYIGSKLLNSKETIEPRNTLDERNSKNDLSQQQIEETANNAKADADQTELRPTDDFLFLQIMEEKSEKVGEVTTENVSEQDMIGVMPAEITEVIPDDIIMIGVPKIF